MIRIFIQTKEFTTQWDRLGLSDEELRKLEWTILKNPKMGKVIRGTGKLRKIRMAFGNQGKSGSARVCYVDFVMLETIYLISIYAKNEKENLSKYERNEIKKAIVQLEQSLIKSREGA